MNENDDVIKKEEGDGTSVEWAKFLHKKNEIFVDFELVREEIEKETARLAGNGKVSSWYDPTNKSIFLSQNKRQYMFVSRK